MPFDTIAAIATPLGEGGLAVVRLSGAEALRISDQCFVPAGGFALKPSSARSHTIHFGHVVRSGLTIDEVLLSVMRAPRTYTREDIVELTCHGGMLPAKLILDTVLALGARLAEPGEFTRRAFLNGRLDLAQAEAVADLIHSQTDLALRAANEQLAGKLSQRINQLRDQMVQILAHVEAHIDFPEEDIAPDTREELVQRLEHGVQFIDRLLETAPEGRILRRGIRVAIIGRPNAGKSSLLNQLLGHDRAIVSAVPGTTRDTIEETANIRGLPVVFIDTAGLREGRDEIEVEGIRRSRKSLENAEMVLHVLDASEPLTPADEHFLVESAQKKRILVRNKIDLPIRLELPQGLAASLEARSVMIPTPVASFPIVDVSCLTGQGIENLKDAIKALVWSGGVGSEQLQVMINSRHQDALSRARAATLRTLDALRTEQTLELVALDLRIAVNAVGEIVGKTTTEDLLDMIFSQFCIGK
ncbi:MAG TPA: tRNA uridine-5-carboxymethylaminomethyl(34) synthesis GTPase MnmE [Verrucomicrobiae bacterium]